MHVANLMEFTENHRFLVNRRFAMSALDRRVLATLYQAIIGSGATSLYFWLNQQIGESDVGYSPLDQQRKLFLGLGIDLNAEGRQLVIKSSSCLEAVSLLQVYRRFNADTEEVLYEYVLKKPLSVSEFFASEYLALLLRDKIGKNAANALCEEFSLQPPTELAQFMSWEDISVHFTDIFQLNPNCPPPEFEITWEEKQETEFAPGEKICHQDILFRFPRGSNNRSYVERLDSDPELLKGLNFLAYKYTLDTSEICRLLDEEGIFRANGSLEWDELQRRANLLYGLNRKHKKERELILGRKERINRNLTENSRVNSLEQTEEMVTDIPEQFQDKVNLVQYNQFLCQEPHTKLLARYFPGAVPTSYVKIFEKIDLVYKLPEPVINILIHYMFVHKTKRITSRFIEKIAENMLIQGVDSFDKAVKYVKDQQQLDEQLKIKGKKGDQNAFLVSKTNRLSHKPVMQVVKNREEPGVTSDELEKMLVLARELKNQ